MTNYYSSTMMNCWALGKKVKSLLKLIPKSPAGLKLGQGNMEDPMVGRLVESVAFLSSQLRYDLDVESNQLSKNALQLLYPHYYLPIPSYSIIQFESSEQQESLYNIERGSRISSDANERAKVIFTDSL